MKLFKFFLITFLIIFVFGCKKEDGLKNNSQSNFEKQLEKIILKIPLHVEYDGIEGVTRYSMPDGQVITQAIDTNKNNDEIIIYSMPRDSSASSNKAPIKLKANGSGNVFNSDESTPLGTIEGAKIICLGQRISAASSGGVYMTEWIENPNSIYPDCSVLRTLMGVTRYSQRNSCNWNGYVNYAIRYRNASSSTGWGVYTVQRQWSATLYL